MVCTTRYLLNAAITVCWVLLCPSVSLSAGRPGNLPLFGSPTTRSLDNPRQPTHTRQANVSTVIGVNFMRTETAAISLDNDCQYVVLISLPPPFSPYLSVFSLFLLNLHICFGAFYGLFNDT